MVFNKPHILIHDNEPVSDSLLTRMLATEYRVRGRQPCSESRSAQRPDTRSDPARRQAGLTNVNNRRRFDLALDAEWRRAMRDSNALSLLMVDVDRFKNYNDLYGHREGDQCLRRGAGAMAQALTRPGDLLTRYSGEEFVVILPGSELEGARLMGNRLRDSIEDMNIPHATRDSRRFTISVGCARACPNQNQTYHQLLQTADDQLYAARKAGRNCVNAEKMAA